VNLALEGARKLNMSLPNTAAWQGLLLPAEADGIILASFRCWKNWQISGSGKRINTIIARESRFPCSGCVQPGCIG
jgi:hypothetical protein